MNKFSFFCNNALKIGTSKFVKLGKKVACVSFHFSVCFFYLSLRLEPSSVLCFAFFCSGSIKAQSSVLSRAYSLLGGLFFVFYNIYIYPIFRQKFFTNFLELTVKCIVEIIQKILHHHHHRFIDECILLYLFLFFCFFAYLMIINMTMVCMRVCVCMCVGGCVYINAC